MATEIKFHQTANAATNSSHGECATYVQLSKLTRHMALSYLYHMNGSPAALVPLFIAMVQALFRINRALQVRSSDTQARERHSRHYRPLTDCARSLASVLLLVSDPPTPSTSYSAVKHTSDSRARSQDLISLQDRARRQSQRYLPPVLMHYVKEELQYPLRAEEKEVLSAAISSLLKCLRGEMGLVFAALREDERDLLGLMLADWKKRR